MSAYLGYSSPKAVLTRIFDPSSTWSCDSKGFIPISHLKHQVTEPNFMLHLENVELPRYIYSC